MQDDAKTADHARHFMDTVQQAVNMRMDAGAHPHDAMLLGYSMIEAWIRVHVDGQYPQETA